MKQRCLIRRRSPTFGSSSINERPTRGKRRGAQLLADVGAGPDVADRFRDGDKRVFALWWFVFPNLALNYYPWGLSVNVFQPVPGKPGRTLFLWYHYVLDEAKCKEREKIWVMTDTDLEDVDALGQVRRGVASGFAPRGRFAPGVEAGPHWFHRKVYEGVF